jgi:hypothetical protein
MERPRPADGEGFLFGEFHFAQADIHPSAGPTALAPAPGPHTIARPESVDDLMLLERERRSSRAQPTPKEPTRYGVMLVFEDLDQMRVLFEWAMQVPTSTCSHLPCSCHLVLPLSLTHVLHVNM